MPVRNRTDHRRQIKVAGPDMTEVLKRSGHNNREIALDAMREFAKSIELPLRQAILAGDIVSDIFQNIPFPQNESPLFPLDFLKLSGPGSIKDHIAYTIPNHGRIPERHIEGDYVMISTFEVGNSIDWLLKFSQFGRWDVVARALQVFNAGFIKKRNDDGWHTILGAGVDRNVLVYDANAAVGQLTKREFSLMKGVMRRKAGGNSSSVNRGRLTDAYMSPELAETMRDWTLADIDDVTRREIFTTPDGQLTEIFQVVIHDIDELGAGQEYQNFYLNNLGGTLATGGDTELIVGLDLVNNDSFVMPVTQEVEVFEDDNFHRQRRAGVYGWGSWGFGVLDSRRIILGSA
jgi:hypothetical protein